MKFLNYRIKKISIIIFLILSVNKIFAQINVESRLSERKFNSCVQDFYIIRQTWSDWQYDSLKNIEGATLLIESIKKLRSQYPPCDSSILFFGNKDTNPPYNFGTKNLDCIPYMPELSLKIFIEILYEYRANIRVVKGDYVGALEDYKKCINLKDFPYINSGSLFNYGVCYYYLQNLKEACKLIRMSSELGDEKAFKFLKENCN